MSNNTNTPRYETDIIPRIGINSDLLKIYNARANQPADILLINNLLNLLETRKGTNKEFPNVGLADSFARISFSEQSEIDQILNNIKLQIIDQIGHDGVELSYQLKNPENPTSDIIIKIEISNLPGAINVKVPQNAYNSTAVETSWAQS